MKRYVELFILVMLALLLFPLLFSCQQQADEATMPTATPTPAITPTPAPSATPTPQVIEVEKKYQVLNPEGILQEVEIYALSPRLESLDGKTIYIIQGEADPTIMPVLAERLPETYPDTTFVYIDTHGSFNLMPVYDTILENADAVILGNVEG